MLRWCESRPDESCLKAYREVRSAVDVVFDHGRKTAFERTLDAIDRECPRAVKRPPPDDLVDACRGAGLALYFFRSDAEDRRVVVRLTQAGDETLKGLFTRFALPDWAGYRPAPARWQALIQRSGLEGGERDEVERAFAGVYARTKTITGKPWRHPAVHMVDPEFVREWARGGGRP